MAWIESHQSLLTHRKTGRLARALGISKITAIGHLHALWWWAMDNAPDGCFDGVDIEDIADGACWEGEPQIFVDALVYAGFVDRTERGICLHDWMDYAGKLIVRRREDAQRKRAERLKLDVQGMSDGQRTDGVRTVPNPTVPNKTEPTTLVSSGEETIKAAPKRARAARSQADDNRSAAFEALWDDYPRRPDGVRAGRKSTARKEFDRISPADWDRVSDALAAYSRSDNVRRGYVQNADRWLRDWQQWLEPPKPPVIERRAGNGAPKEKTRFEATEEYFNAIFSANTNGQRNGHRESESITPIDRPRLRGGPPETA